MMVTTDVHGSVQAERVLTCLRERIQAANGWLPFDAYMQIALYEPGLGYYSAGAHKLGAGGDFTTAPEISPLFGQCIAVQCEQVLRALPGAEVLELGAGTGRLAFDVLSELARRESLPRSYRILEISADLRERQQKLLSTLPALAERVQWIDQPPSEPWRGVILANEVLDALPCKRFLQRDSKTFELGVAMDDAGALHWQERPAEAALLAEVREIHDSQPQWPSPYVSELCTLITPWVAEITASLSQGIALFIDYGLPRHEYYHPSRSEGTLRCHYRHRAHDNPFAHPGLEDITAWVDFTRVAEAGAAAGLEVLGYATQAGLLLSLGIESPVVQAENDLSRASRASQARRLLMPEEMGETFKAIALGRGWDSLPLGFKYQDQRARL
jgi:SAM-dependent MidA family methyltransferase